MVKGTLKGSWQSLHMFPNFTFLSVSNCRKNTSVIKKLVASAKFRMKGTEHGYENAFTKPCLVVNCLSVYFYKAILP